MSPTYEPLYIDGKRDTRRRYISDAGEIISRRKYIIESEGVTPEEKAYKRYQEGKSSKGKTVKKVERRKKKKRKEIEKERKDSDVSHVSEKDMYRQLQSEGKKLKHQGTHQLNGHYEFWNPRLKEAGDAIGYSTHTRGKRTGIEYLILREQAVNHARAQLPFSGWQLTGIKWEQWLLW